MLIYNGSLTRMLYRCVVTNSRPEMRALLAQFRENGVRIGVVYAQDVLQEYSRTCAQESRLRDRTIYYEELTEREDGPLDRDGWDMDGCWVPEKE